MIKTCNFQIDGIKTLYYSYKGHNYNNKRALVPLGWWHLASPPLQPGTPQIPYF